MMKKILAVFALVALCMSAEASFLYWQVDQADYQGITNWESVNSFGLFAVNGSEKVMISDYDGSAGQLMGPVDVTNYSTYSFYVELYNYNGSSYSVMGQGEQLSYTTLFTNGYIMNDPLSVTQVSVWHGVAINHENPSGGGGGTPGGYNAPEPTSAMLLLIGLAGLSLKRKQI